MTAVQSKTEVKKVLIVDDDPVDQRFIKRALSKAREDVVIDVASDGTVGLRAIADSEELPDVVIFDLNMPRLDGIGFIYALRENPRTRHLPALALSTSMDEQEIRNCYRKGTNAYMIKPASLEGYDRLARSIVEFWFDVATTPGPR